MAIRAEESTKTAEDLEQILVTINPPDIHDLFVEPGALDPLVEKVRARVSSFVPDIITAQGRKDIASLAYKVTRTKTFMDGLGKELNASLKELPKQVDENRRRAWDQLEALAKEIRKPLDQWEAEQERIKAQAATLSMIPESFMSHTADEFQAMVDDRHISISYGGGL